MGMLDIEFNLQGGQQANYVYLAMCPNQARQWSQRSQFSYINLKHVCSIYDMSSSVYFSQTIQTLL